MPGNFDTGYNNGWKYAGNAPVISNQNILTNAVANTFVASPVGAFTAAFNVNGVQLVSVMFEAETAGTISAQLVAASVVPAGFRSGFQFSIMRIGGGIINSGGGLTVGAGGIQLSVPLPILVPANYSLYVIHQAANASQNININTAVILL